MAVILVIVSLLFAFAYGGYRRTQRAQAAARDAGLPRNVGPATEAGGEFIKSIPDGTAPFARKGPLELQPPPTPGQERRAEPCGSNPQTGQPYRYNPQTGQPCDGLPQERVIVRQAPAARPQPVAAPIVASEATPEEKRLAAAYAREQEARMAPMGIRNIPNAAGFGSSTTMPSGINSRCSNSSIISRRWKESLARWQDRNRSPYGGKKGLWPEAMTGY